APAAPAGIINLSGSNADGYLAVVNINQEPNQGLGDLISDPSDPKFFDYPSYVNPENPANIFVMIVEPYVFGLSYPAPLHSALGTPGNPPPPGTFLDVGPLQQRNPDGSVPAGATFVDGFTEDADFNLSDVGTIDFDSSLLTGFGTEIIAPGDLTLNLDASEFNPQNRTKLNDADFGFDPSDPLGTVNPEGRSNRNESALFAGRLSLTPTNLTGTGLTFQDGVLTSIDMDADVNLTNGLINVDGGLTFSGTDFAFDIDDVQTTGFARNVRTLLNRTATLDAVGTFSVAAVPEPGTMALCGLAGFGGLVVRRRKARRAVVTAA
ncbi:MAG: PEP-CTERM sorting domain-containing protein, partial [Planctomycetota bacterium]